LVIAGPIDGITDADATALEAVVKGHNAFALAVSNDCEVITALLGIDMSRPRKLRIGMTKEDKERAAQEEREAKEANERAAKAAKEREAKEANERAARSLPVEIHSAYQQGERAQLGRVTDALMCPSYVRCDHPLGKSVFAHTKDWVVKVFTDSAKLRAEIRAHEVLRKFYEAKTGVVKPLRFEVVKPEPPKYDATHLRIERLVPWSALKSLRKTLPLWQLKEQIPMWHVSGIAHGALTPERIGLVDDARFAVTCSHQVVSPLSEFFDGELGHDETRVAGILRQIVTKGGVRSLLRTVVIVGPIDGITDADAGAVDAVVSAHNAFALAAEEDARVLAELFYIGINTPSTLRLGKMATGEAMALLEANAARMHAAAARWTPITITDETMGCAECGAAIHEGYHGRVYHHNQMPGKVVKVFHERAKAQDEARAYGVLRRVSESDRSFRSLRAELLPEPRARACMLIDKFKAALSSYVGADYESAMKRDGVGTEHFRDLLDQLDILHRHGVAHGDLHSGNIGLLDTGFVIGDPTLLHVSPLSELYDEPVDPDAKPILDALRKATKQGRPGLASPYRWVLNKPLGLAPSDVRGLLHEIRVDDSDDAAKHALAFIDAHDKVTREMRLDRAKLRREFGSLQSDAKWLFVFEGLRVWV
jgi:tRNA A-37 threonylcarbamoyl transferase component Bud32